MALMAKAAVQTTVRLSQEMYDQAKGAAEKRPLPLNTWITEAIAEKLAKEGRNANK